jgi:polysaccharide chain length determinant protein (PEP-CTERM system associated)
MQIWRAKALTHVAAAWQYRWTAVAVAWIVCLVGWTGVIFIPDTYESEAKVYIDTDTLLGPLLRGLAITTDADQKVEVMLKTLITRPNLEQVVRLTDPKADKLSAGQMAARVDALIEKVEIRPLGPKNMFGIGYSNPSPDYSQLVTQTLVSILIDSNIGDKRRDAEGAKSFIDQRIAEYESMLRRAEKRRADFRAANLDLLANGPVGAQVDAANTMLRSANEELSNAIVRRDSLAGQLGGVPKTVASNPIVIDTAGEGRRSVGTLEQAREALAELRSKYTEDYPDVVAARHAVEQLEKAQSAPVTAETPTGEPNPFYVELKKQLSAEEVNVAIQQHRIAEAQQAIANAKSSTTKAIDVETKYADLDRDYSTIEGDYQALLKSRESARMSQALDDTDQTITIRVVEPPEKPQTPATPNRPLLNFLVLAAGILGGAAAAFFLGFYSGHFVTGDQVVEAFDLPLIGVVAMGENTVEARRMRMASVSIGLSVLLLAICYVTVAMTIRTSLHLMIGGFHV